MSHVSDSESEIELPPPRPAKTSAHRQPVLYSEPDETTEEVRQHALRLQDLVSRFEDGEFPSLRDFYTACRATGASNAEILDYQDQIRPIYQQCHAPIAPEPVADDAEPIQTEEVRRALRETQWAAFEAKVNALQDTEPVSTAFLDRLLASASTSTSGISSSVLAAAPHLAKLITPESQDPILQQTFKLRSAFGAEKDVDGIVDLLQSQHILDPFARSLWRLIVQDRFVDFEKLYASIVGSSDVYDDGKEFAGGYLLVKKEGFAARRPLSNEADWTRVFEAWSSGVGLVYPHRIPELVAYRKLIIELFRAGSADPLFPIRVDKDVRERYSKAPFRMDDRNVISLPLLSQLLRAGPSSQKRSLEDRIQQAPGKRRAVVCLNWNLGRCSEPCVGKRMHGQCSECSGKHAANTRDQCRIALSAKRGISGGGTGASSSA